MCQVPENLAAVAFKTTVDYKKTNPSPDGDIMDFKLKSKFKPTGDQPAAIKKLVDGLKKGHREQTLLGVTGSGKTFIGTCKRNVAFVCITDGVRCKFYFSHRIRLYTN